MTTYVQQLKQEREAWSTKKKRYVSLIRCQQAVISGQRKALHELVGSLPERIATQYEVDQWKATATAAQTELDELRAATAIDTLTLEALHRGMFVERARMLQILKESRCVNLVHHIEALTHPVPSPESAHAVVDPGAAIHPVFDERTGTQTLGDPQT